MLRKEVRKSSYYVWSLGIELAKGLRGPEVVEDALRKLLLRMSEETSVDPVKVTLQISHKGVKILQNKTCGRSGKPEQKEFIPHSVIMFVQQAQDVVAFVVFLLDSKSQWPLQMNAYRCDSVETAHNLTNQLHVLINQPKQQKVADIKSYLKSQCVLQHEVHDLAMRPQSSTASSVSSAESSSEDVASLYMSLAAELRKKLSLISKEPLLLPPKDYDTINRQRGNLAAGGLWHGATRAASSRGSSVMDSDHAVSPYKSEEEWVISMDNDPVRFTLPEKKPTDIWQTSGEKESELLRAHCQPSGFVQAPLEHCLIPNNIHSGTAVEHQRSPSPSQLSASKMKSDDVGEAFSPHDRFKDAKEKFLLLERERLSEHQNEISHKTTRPVEPVVLSPVHKEVLPCNDFLQIRNKLAKCTNHDASGEEAVGQVCSRHEYVRPHEIGRVCCQNICRFKVLPRTGENPSQYYSPYLERTDNIYKKKVDNVESCIDCKYNCQFKHSQRNYVLKDLPIRKSPQFSSNVDRQSNRILSNINSENGHDKLLHIFERPTGNTGLQVPVLNSFPGIEYSCLNGRPHRAMPGTPYNMYHKTQHETNKKTELVDKGNLVFGVLENVRRRHPNELVNEFKRKSFQDSSCLESLMGEKNKFPESSQANRRQNSNYQELSDHERFPGLDRDTARLQHHNNFVNITPSESNSARYHHSYVGVGFHGSE